MGQVRTLLGKALGHSRCPAARQLLEGAHVEIAIVKESLELRHVAGKKAPVLANAVAAHGRSAGFDEWREKFDGTRFRFRLRDGAGAHPCGQSRRAVLLLV